MLRVVIVVGLVVLLVGMEASSMVTFDEGFAQVNVSGTDGLMDSPWPMFGHDVRHTGRSPYDTSTNKGRLKWKIRTNPIKDSPVIDKDGTVYVGADEWFHAVNPDGTVKWIFETSWWIKSAAAIAEDGTIYVGDGDGYLYAIYPDGREKWRIKIGGWVVGDPAIGDNGVVYVGASNGDGDFCAVYPNGTLKWCLDLGRATFSPVIGNNGTIFVGTYDGYLFAVSPEGEIEWKIKVHGPVREEVAVGDDGTIYFGTSLWPGDNYFYAVYPNNGTVKWRYHIYPGGGSYIMGLAIAEDGTLYFSTGEGLFYALDKNGVLKWKVEISFFGWETFAFPAIGKDGTIYMAGKSKAFSKQHGYLYAISPTGEVKWRVRLESDEVYDVCCPAAPVIGEDGTVYIGAWFVSEAPSWGYLYAFGPVDDPPYKPDIKGPTSGRAGVEYEYVISTLDPDGDDVYYYVDWDDGETEEWIGPYTSGEKITLSHIWTEKGMYIIRAKARDTNGLESDWATLEVSMPKSKTFVNILRYLRILERFTSRFPLLDPLFISYPLT
jgi:outer membrane protein assembly factor BamB